MRGKRSLACACRGVALGLLLVVSGRAAAFTVKVHADCAQRPELVPQGAIVEAFAVTPGPNGAFTTVSLPVKRAPGRADGIIDEKGDATITFDWPTADTPARAKGPNLIFRLTQNIAGCPETVYDESAASCRQDQADGVEVKLTVNAAPAEQIVPEGGTPDAAVPYPVLGLTVPGGATADPGVTLAHAVCVDSRPRSKGRPDKSFKFTRVGNCGVDKIDCHGLDSASTGYYLSRRTAGNTGTNTDQPFGGVLDLFGSFGSDCKIRCYKVRYSTDSGAKWKDVTTNLPNKWYYKDQNPLLSQWKPQSMGPCTAKSMGVTGLGSDQGNFYTAPLSPAQNPDQHNTWQYPDRIAVLDTTKLPNGRVLVSIEGWKLINGGKDLVRATDDEDIALEPNYGIICLQVDNSMPTVKIEDVLLGTASRQPCDVMELGTDAAQTLSVVFTVSDALGHLRDYTLAALYGANLAVSPPPSKPNPATDDYGKQPGTGWTGSGTGKYTTSYGAAAYPPKNMPTCAYQFRLTASKRTTNGYNATCAGIAYTYNLTIKRPPAPP